ncbi:hypothetical protein CVD28_01255 [Bacillus sp. M6-12]|uniref:C40 family peptidase n=1 Tax=Bacillus sp. M6-12 TaxID=2054166 RepID=UPI000C77C9BE|nr:peptidoglycan endopeptidase [Bacillus sp. M6-12]PLS19061.1 hypothetical protein CVD28_01255 [Bacillus sp. M6-12]
MNKHFKTLLLASVMTATLSTPAFANEASTHTVKSGDTLYLISKAYNTTISSLKETNGLQSDLIKVGQVLRIPSANTFSYTVKSGDSLSAIAKNNQTTVGHIVSINNLPNTAIKVGQVLKIEKNSNQYTVQSGDTLYKISVKFGTSVNEIKATNHLTTDIIHIGQKLEIPYRALLNGGVSAPVVTNPAPTPAPAPTVEVPTTSNWESTANAIIAEGAKKMSTPYEYGATRILYWNKTDNPNFTGNTFDCSSFVQYAFYKGANFKLSGDSRSQSLEGTTISLSQIRKGDLLFYSTSDRVNNTGVERIGHVGIYVGDGKMLHASTSKGVMYSDINTTYWNNMFVKVQRVLN